MNDKVQHFATFAKGKRVKRRRQYLIDQGFKPCPRTILSNGIDSPTQFARDYGQQIQRELGEVSHFVLLPQRNMDKNLGYELWRKMIDKTTGTTT